jgi:hypothetical protein
MNLVPNRHAYSWLRRTLFGMALIGVVVGRAPSQGARDDASATVVTRGRINAAPQYHDESRLSHIESRELLVAVLFLLESKSSSR